MPGTQPQLDNLGPQEIEHLLPQRSRNALDLRREVSVKSCGSRPRALHAAEHTKIGQMTLRLYDGILACLTGKDAAVSVLTLSDSLPIARRAAAGPIGPGIEKGTQVLTDSRYEEGLAVRKEVLGESYVGRSLANADDFSRPFQEFITRYCWGEVWSRPGLPRSVRSLLTLGMLTALAKPAEVETHVRGALNNGCSSDEIFEALLQATIYCGVPAGLDAMRVAQRVIAEQTASDGEPDRAAESVAVDGAKS